MDKHPPEGPLPSLPRHVACALRRERLERRTLQGAAHPVLQRDEGRLGAGGGGRFGGIQVHLGRGEGWW